jgi:hypothetical protein
MSIAVYWGDEIPPATSYLAYFGDIDIAFCSSPVYQKHFEDAGIAAVMIGNAFDPPARFEVSVQKTHDFVFCGTSGFGIPEHFNRYNILKELLATTTLEIYSNERHNPRNPKVSLRSTIRSLAVAIAGATPKPMLAAARELAPRRISHLAAGVLRAKEAGLTPDTVLPRPVGHPMLRIYDNEKPLQELFPGRLKPQKTFMEDYYGLIAGSKLVLNIHRDEDADIGNIRCFEATGLGSCLITDRRDGLREFFDVDNDVVTFDTARECAEKVRHLLSHPDEMERIAKNGMRTTLARHTVAVRCKKIAAAFRDAHGWQNARRRRVLVATYDLQHHPVSYDIAFFVQAAEIQRQQSACDSIALTIAVPRDIDHQPGVSAAVNSIVDGRAREYRINHICVETAQLMQSVASITVKYRAGRDFDFELATFNIIRYPPEQVNHDAYYQFVNSYPDLVSGFSSTVEARRYVRKWLDSVSIGRKVLCVTLRQYQVNPERNSNMGEWKAFLERLDYAEYAVVVVPDTDQIGDFKTSSLSAYPSFDPACFNVDLRWALYELAYLNMFVNNGPSVAATLNKRVNYLMFKITLPGVPTGDPAFLKSLGFDLGATPKYATRFQRWVWEEDTADVLHREFLQMDELIRAPRQ